MECNSPSIRHPYISKTFASKTDATRWANLTEVKLSVKIVVFQR